MLKKLIKKFNLFLEKHRYAKFIYELFYVFFEKEGMQRANSLAYTILLSFVPFFISIASITTFFLSATTYAKLENYIFANYLPSLGDQITPYMESFHKHSGKLSLVSFSFLFVTSIFMFRSLRHHLTKLCGTKKVKERLGQSLLTNIIIMTAGPISVALGIIITSYINSAIKLDYTVVLLVLSLCLSILAFTMIYKFLSLNYVKFSHALIAGSVAGVMFEIAKKGFVIYIKYFAVESVLYGTLAIIPIFLLWLYICCLILLLCASILAELEKKVVPRK